MKLAGTRILLTGASGGIGRCLALEFARRGAGVALLGRDASRLQAVLQSVHAIGGSGLCVPFDLARREGHAAVVARVNSELGGLDMLVNNAGVSRFATYAEDDPQALCNLVDINLTGALLLTRAVLPALVRRRAGHIVNIGSILGSIAVPHFAAYSATKFALRGFSEALRRELAGSGVRVTYVAPRTTLTGMNTDLVREFFSATRTAVDRPEQVASHIAAAVEQGRSDIYLGWPERFFVRLNGMLPRLVDSALVRQARIADRLLHPHARVEGPRRTS
jgi:short-subunit dehydrogenase